ncbi:MAG: hypothetical protein WBO44_13040, partial [Saprospiraceae bacterium]
RLPLPYLSLFDWLRFPRYVRREKKLDVFAPRIETALDTIVREAKSFAEAYQASFEINEENSKQ